MSTGTRVYDLLGDGSAVVAHPADAVALEAAWAESVSTALPFDQEFRRRLADGSWCWSRSRATAQFDSQGRVVCWHGATEDIRGREAVEAAYMRLTERLEARLAEEVAAREATQERLNQAQRMQALGRVASGIAHDFNNVLQVIGSALFLIATRPDDAVRVARFAALADDAAGRGAAITGRLLSLARKGGPRAGPVDPVLLLSSMAEVLRHTLGANITVRVEAVPGLPFVLADRGQLETVLINLAANARDAMSDGGVLTLSAARDPFPADVEVSGGVLSSPGGYVRIAVTDTGEGMDAAILARASEPFFTTKEAGCGTGLGLAMAQGFTEQSNGALQIESAPGVGTTVQIWLPCATRAASAPLERFKALRLPKLRGRVLLVDDDALVRVTLTEQLQEFGMSVVSACDGVAGLRALAEDAGITLLVSDLTMPGMDGMALIEAAQQARPGLPAILVTGHPNADVALASKGSSTGPVCLLRKPVSAACLAEEIVALLEPPVRML
jgi:signal transduction histidine kinase